MGIKGRTGNVIIWILRLGLAILIPLIAFFVSISGFYLPARGRCAQVGYCLGSHCLGCGWRGGSVLHLQLAGGKTPDGMDSAACSPLSL